MYHVTSWILTYMARSDHTLRLLSDNYQSPREVSPSVSVPWTLPKRCSLPLHYAMFLRAIYWSKYNTFISKGQENREK